MEFSQYTIKEIKEIFKILDSHESGLSGKEAAKRQVIHGFNEVAVKEIGLLDILIRQLKSPFFYLLFIAAIFYLLAGEFIDGSVILVFIFINIFLGFFQEARAVKTAALLKKYLSPRARVKREGEEKNIDQKFLVPGDIVLLEAGNIIPADLRILKAINFLVDEEVLSGESVPVTKISQALLKETNEIFEAKNIVFAGTSVISGEAEGIVIGTGKETVFGEIAKLTGETIHKGVYERNLLNFSRLILRIVIATIIIVLSVNLMLKGTANLLSFSVFCIALVISIIPEALPVVVTFALSEGAQKLAKKKVVVKRLSAIEDLGDIEILCTDKTGTLTENKLSLCDIFSPDKEKCLLYGLLLSSAIKEEIESTQNPFDAALLEGASQKVKGLLSGFKEISELPFDSTRLRNSALLEDQAGKKILIVKGAPEIVLNISSRIAGDRNREQIREEIVKEGVMVQ